MDRLKCVGKKKKKQTNMFEFVVDTYLEEGNNERPQREICCLVEFGVELFYGQGGVLSKTTERGMRRTGLDSPAIKTFVSS